MKTINILFVGDIIGEVGFLVLQKHLTNLVKKYKIRAVIVNGENAAKGGRGLSPQNADAIRQLGVDVITSGNHIWAHNAIGAYLDEHHELVRPANFPAGCPGVGATSFAVDDVVVGVLNLQGRVFIKENTDCPLRTAQSILSFLQAQTKIIMVDFHAEATAEKAGLAAFLDGKVSAVLGTHTHVQTSDERVLPGGTAFISDVGMVGSFNSIIGFKKESVLRGLLTQMPARFEVDYAGPYVLNAVAVEVNRETGLAQGIERIRVIDHDLVLKKE